MWIYPLILNSCMGLRYRTVIQKWRKSNTFYLQLSYLSHIYSNYLTIRSASHNIKYLSFRTQNCSKLSNKYTLLFTSLLQLYDLLLLEGIKMTFIVRRLLHILQDRLDMINIQIADFPAPPPQDSSDSNDTWKVIALSPYTASWWPITRFSSREESLNTVVKNNNSKQSVSWPEVKQTAHHQCNLTKNNHRIQLCTTCEITSVQPIQQKPHSSHIRKSWRWR